MDAIDGVLRGDLIDAIIIIPLLMTLTSKLATVLFHFAGIALAAVAALAIGPSFSQVTPDFGYSAVLMHIFVLALCLALFRKRDVEMCRFTTATLIHETKRALSTFEGTANYFEKRLPEIVSQYRNSAYSSEGAISQAELNTMMTLPDEVKKLSQRTRNLLTKFYDQISSYSGNRTFTNVNLNDCILTAITDSSLDKKLRECIHFNTGTDLIVKGDHDQLVQVLINLLENSGHALISTESPRIDITVLGQTLFVTDNGKGISPVDLPNIFDELFSTKSSSGQGLAFCKRAMIEHGGSILCTSKKNEFTRFELRFPAKYEWSSKC
jgi:signal transduction histidine kinase